MAEDVERSALPGETEAGIAAGMVHLDRAGLRALAHPLRARLVGALRLHGAATATALAHRLGTNSGATSYHLRQLAGAGLVEEDPDLGTARERWWRAAHRGTSFRDTDFENDPDDRAAADWLVGHTARLHTRWHDDWLEERHTWPRAWRDVADQSDYWLHLTPDQLHALNLELHEVIQRHRDAGDPADPAAERIVALWSSFPAREPRL
jgi:DNA-binding transcriptional ArsR family regulator